MSIMRSLFIGNRRCFEFEHSSPSCVNDFSKKSSDHYSRFETLPFILPPPPSQTSPFVPPCQRQVGEVFMIGTEADYAATNILFRQEAS